jgi:branched-chain amino acid transport system ATP-binding protein
MSGAPLGAEVRLDDARISRQVLRVAFEGDLAGLEDVAVVGHFERRAQLAGTLSGGERQMLAVGRALMSQPKLLMLDEPSLGLAPLVVREIFRIIERLRADGVSILLVEQNARAALEVADYGYVLETGEIVLHGPAAQLAGDPRVIETYLGAARATSAGT